MHRGGMNALTTAVATVAAAGAGTWLGFKIRPRALAVPHAGTEAGEVALPDNLPAPVARHYRAAGYGGPAVPRAETFALWGRARMKRDPLPWLPVTFWSEHRVGWSGRQRLAVTWYTIPVLHAVDDFVDGRGQMRIGRQRVTGPEIDQGENLFLWAELVLVPSVLATRPGVRWENVGAESARLRVPFGAGEDELVFQFDPDTGLIRESRAMRYRTPGKPKVGWRIGYERWSRFAAGMFPARITVTWEDQGRPWFVLDVDGVAVNVPVAADLTAGPTIPA
jgi:hypothetical protein